MKEMQHILTNRITNRSTLGYWLALIAWMGLIFAFSHQPSLPNLPGSFIDLVFKKTAHFCAYGLLMILWYQALQTVRPATRSSLFLALALTVLYAASDEWHQTFIPNRSGQLADVLVDTAGALTVLLVILRRNRLAV